MINLSQGISNTHKDAIFSQASFTKNVWDLAVEVMDLFEHAKLKGQKLNLSTLLTKPEFKQQYFAPIRRLGEEEQCYLLTKVYKYPYMIVAAHNIHVHCVKYRICGCSSGGNQRKGLSLYRDGYRFKKGLIIIMVNVHDRLLMGSVLYLI